MPQLPHIDDLKSRSLAAISRIDAVPALLRVICESTGMGYAAVARVTEDHWVACAVQDNIGFGIKPGDELPIETTLCKEARLARQPVVIDHASQDPVYRTHHTPRIYGIESYISVPIVRMDGDYFGNLCAIDPKPAHISEPRLLSMFQLFAELIALQLETEDRAQASETALLDAHETADLRETFIAALGHDLRSPLSAVLASSELLIRGPDRAQTMHIGERLRTITRRMARMVDDMLDYTRGRLGSGIGITVENTDDLATALRDVIEELRAAHPGRVVNDHLVITQDVSCDRGRVQQLLANLLGNAFTYGAADSPIVVEATTKGGELTLCVANGGTPISPANLSRVFEPYWRPATSTPGGGLGLGLYICSEIVKAHHGTLQAESSAKDGTRFTARLPLHGPTS